MIAVRYCTKEILKSWQDFSSRWRNNLNDKMIYKHIRQMYKSTLSEVLDMQQVIESSNLKVILHSKRANLYYLEKCRVMQKDGRVLYLTEGKKENQYWNIPIANTTVILLGTGTSITQAAMRMLVSAGVMVGFCGAGATPLFAGTEVEWLSPQSEYRPTEYVQGWLSFWFDEEKRLSVAKDFQKKRYAFLEKVWKKDKGLSDYGLYADELDGFSEYAERIDAAESVLKLLAIEAAFTKKIYKYIAQTFNIDGFVRSHGTGDDMANSFLDHGNYLAYGLSAVTLWALGIPHGFAVMHGKTRRGALVFDVADLIKDAVVLPWAFLCAAEGMSAQEYRQICVEKFTEHKVLDFMFDEVKSMCGVWYKGGALK